MFLLIRKADIYYYGK